MSRVQGVYGAGTRTRVQSEVIRVRASGTAPSYRSSLVKLAQDLGIEKKVTFLEWWGDMADFYAAIDVLVHPAVHEPLGRTVIEAMGCGVPAVA